MMVNQFFCIECGEKSSCWASIDGAKSHVRREHAVPTGMEESYIETTMDRADRLDQERKDKAKAERQIEFELEQTAEELEALGWYEDDFGAEDFLYWTRGPQSA